MSDEENELETDESSEILDEEGELSDLDAAIQSTASMANPEAITQQLGITRWVQFAFIGLAACLFWFFLQITRVTWELLAQEVSSISAPNPTFFPLIAGVIAVAIAIGCYQKDSIRRWANEVAIELKRSTWPDKKETWSNTVVVLIFTAVSAIILFVFDAAWSSLTDYIY